MCIGLPCAILSTSYKKMSICLSTSNFKYLKLSFKRIFWLSLHQPILLGFVYVNDFKKCYNTIIEKNGLLCKRNFKLHDSFKNIEFNVLNLENSYYMIAQNNINSNYFIFSTLKIMKDWITYCL